MGRTNPTYRDYLQRLEDDCQPFRRGVHRKFRTDWLACWLTMPTGSCWGVSRTAQRSD